MKLGSVRIGTLYDFRRIESHGKERGDEEEGVRVSITDGKAGFIGGERLPWFVRESLPPVDGITFRFAEGAFLEVHQTAPDAYVYCTCSKFDASIMERFGGACIEIVDPGQFFAAITRALDGWTSGGVRRVSSLRVATCQYVAREQTWPNVLRYEPVFRKPPEYAYQCEVRAVWDTSLTRLVPLNLTVPDIRKWCRRIASLAA